MAVLLRAPAPADEEAAAGSGSSQIAQMVPFVSGHFEYGIGRPASKRTVFMFMRKAHLAGGQCALASLPACTAAVLSLPWALAPALQQPL
jgi:hypothetical protein